jgi:hypothetical protein
MSTLRVTAAMVSFQPDKSSAGINCAVDDSLNIPSQRKPLSGHLSLRVQAVADVDHAATGRFSRGPETFVNIKVEDTIKGRTKPTRNDRWIDEVHDFNTIRQTRSSCYPLACCGYAFQTS